MLERFSALLPYDVTEVTGLDSLYEADGAIAAAEKKTADLFNSEATLFSAGGCTLAIQTMLALALKPGDKVAMGRNMHRSAINAAALLDLKPVFLYGEAETGGLGGGFSGVVSAETVRAAIKSHTDIKAVYLTSPDYYGRLCDIKAISRICHDAGIPLLADNAHGAHLAFIKPSLHPLHLGADMTACSAHKTLPVLTGGAWLHIGNKQYVKDAKNKMSLFGSTSPSYPVMMSLELCRAYLEKEGKPAYAELGLKAAELRELTSELGIDLSSHYIDPVRLTLDTGKVSVSGVTAARYLERNGIQPEYADAGHVVLILTPFHDERDFKRLKDGIKLVAELPPEVLTVIPPQPPPESVMSVRTAALADSVYLDTPFAVGKIAAEAVCPCPPGIPVLIPGEIISKETSEVLTMTGNQRIKVVK